MSARRVVLGLALAAAAAACGDGTPKPAAMDPVSPAEAATLAAAFEKAMEPCDPAALGELLDLDTVLRRAAHAADIKKAEREQVYKGMMSVRHRLPEQLCGSLATDLRFDLLRIRDIAGRPMPLFRGLGDDGLNYFELELGKSKTDGKVRVVDLYIYVAGERLSDNFARLATAGVAVTRDRVGGDLGLEQITAAHRRGDDAEARRLLNALPPKLRDTKQVRLMELQMVDAEDPEYQRLLEDFARAFPDDPAIEMITVDSAFLRKDLPRLLDALDRVDRRTGGDPYLDFMRATAYQLEPTPEHLAAAEAAARRAVAAMPDEQTVHVGLLGVQVARKDYAGALATLDLLATRFDTGINSAQVAGDPVWQGFLSSPEYKAWLARRP